jgi:broad specificity phosphatase PhoE
MVIAIRHGATDWNAKASPGGTGTEVLRGNIDVPLNAAGIQQAQTTATRVCQYPLEKVLGTPKFQRVKQTRDIIAQACGVPVVDAPQFAPYDPGDLSGKPLSAIVTILELLIDVPLMTAPNGGSYADYFQNFANAWQELYSEYGGDDSRAAAVVLFGNEFRALPAVLRGDPIQKPEQQTVQPGQFLVIH